MQWSQQARFADYIFHTPPHSTLAWARSVATNSRTTAHGRASMYRRWNGGSGLIWDKAESAANVASSQIRVVFRIKYVVAGFSPRSNVPHCHIRACPGRGLKPATTYSNATFRLDSLGQRTTQAHRVRGEIRAHLKDRERIEWRSRATLDR